jgi:protoporphyrinogen oxidase
MPENLPVVVIGAGPAGLTAAYQLGRRGVAVSVFEADDVVGGLCRTVERDGWRFGIGGHRFVTTVARVEAMWREVLDPDAFLRRPRLSRIHCRGRLLDYPLRPVPAVRRLGLVESVRCAGSYAWARLRPPRDQSHVEGWVSARFGRRFYRIFFKDYTEKVWGAPAASIPAAWATRRVRRDGAGDDEEFHYPRSGPGMMWEQCAVKVAKAGGTVDTGTWVRALHRRGDRVTAVTVVDAESERTVPAGHVISSMPLSALIEAMDPPPPARILAAAGGLRYRDFLTVALIVPAEMAFPDNSIYVHTPGVHVGRIQNYGSWSPYLVQDGRTCLGLEYFLSADDVLWNAPDDELVLLAAVDLQRLGLIPAGTVEAGHVVRVPRAYPVDRGHRSTVDTIRRWLERCAVNVHPVGHNGLHRTNNLDHSMLTAMLTVENILDGAGHDVWSVNSPNEG